MNLSGGPGFPEGGDANSIIYFLLNVLQIKPMIMNDNDHGGDEGTGVLAVGCVGGGGVGPVNQPPFKFLSHCPLYTLN